MASNDRQGIVYGLSAYGLWGLLPLYFPLLQPAGPLEILAHRILWSAVLSITLVVVLGRRSGVANVLRQRRTFSLLALAAALVAVNWGIYVYAVNSGHVVEAAMGYYVNPLLTVLFGVGFFNERLRRSQWVAVALGATAVVVLTVEYGRLPWIALGLACSFASYGLVKKHVGPSVDALTGLTLEASILAPVAAGFIAWLMIDGSATFNEGAGHSLLLASSGVITLVPLLLFAAATRRVPLSLVGLMQYLAPTLQFLIGVFVAHESMSRGRWIGFAFVWAALILLTADSLRHSRRPAIEPVDL